eukprot:1579222-Rhodomonas_salina.1
MFPSERNARPRGVENGASTPADVGLLRTETATSKSPSNPLTECELKMARTAAKVRRFIVLSCVRPRDDFRILLPASPN